VSGPTTFAFEQVEFARRALSYCALPLLSALLYPRIAADQYFIVCMFTKEAVAESSLVFGPSGVLCVHFLRHSKWQGPGLLIISDKDAIQKHSNDGNALYFYSLELH
jgi:hypothetical protein